VAWARRCEAGLKLLLLEKIPLLTCFLVWKHRRLLEGCIYVDWIWDYVLKRDNG
jgi:hypothetical protein